MKILVLSDTHESRYWKSFIKTFDFNKYDLLIHAGDNYSDIYDLKEYYNNKIVAVPGLWRAEYQNPKIENIKLLEFDKFNILVSHVEKEGRVLRTEDKYFIQIFGHTHAYLIEKNEGYTRFNPGHLKNSIDRGFEASYGEIIVEDNTMKLYVKKAIDSRIILEKTITM